MAEGEDRFWEEDRPEGQPRSPTRITVTPADRQGPVDKFYEEDRPAKSGRSLGDLLFFGQQGPRYQLFPERMAREIGQQAKDFFLAPSRALQGEFGHPTGDLDPELLKIQREGAMLWSPTNPAYRAGSRYGAPPQPAGYGGPTVMHPFRSGAPGSVPGEVAGVTAAELGAPLPRGYTGNQGTQILTQAARAQPITGQIIEGKVAATRGAAADRLEGIAGELGEPGRVGLGTNMRSSLDDLVVSNKQTINDAYSDLRYLINPDQVFIPRHTQSAYERILRERMAARQQNPEAGLEQTGNMVREGISVNGLIRAKNDLAQTVDFLAQHAGMSAGDKKRLGDAMKRDLHEHVTHSVQPGVTREQALAAVRNAENVAAPLIEQNKQVADLIGSSAEGLGGALATAGREKSGNVALLAGLKRSLPADQFNQIAGQALHEMGFNTTANKFTLDQFATQWGKFSEQAKGVMFTPQHRKFLDDIAQLGRHMKEAEVAMNRSGTGRAGGLTALAAGVGASIGGAVWTGDLQFLLGLGASAASSYALAKAMARPEIAASAARFARHAIKYDRHPNMAAAGALRLAVNDYMRMMKEGGYLYPSEMGQTIQRQMGVQPEGGRPYPPGPELPSLDINAP